MQLLFLEKMAILDFVKQQIPHNTAQLWDHIWESFATSDDADRVAEESRSIRWQRLSAAIIHHSGHNLDNVRVVEIGAGVGTAALLLARQGAQVTILDYSPKALERSKAIFDRNNLKADFLETDALNLPGKVLGKFDISLSFGLAEHFRGADRRKIIAAHFDVLRPGGLALISVPNALNLPYRVYKAVSTLRGNWQFGEEYPFTRPEIRDMALAAHGIDVSFFGDNFWHSWHFLFPRLAKTSLHKEQGSLFDPYLSYALVLVATKGNQA